MVTVGKSISFALPAVEPAIARGESSRIDPHDYAAPLLHGSSTSIDAPVHGMGYPPTLVRVVTKALLPRCAIVGERTC
jgi:hypothetical protein